MATKPLILLAEDAVDVRELVDTALTEAGYDVASASGGKQSYELIRQLLPDLVILDLRLFGGETGLDVLREMRANQHTAHIPTIVYSADVVGLRQLTDEIAGFGAVALAKPFGVEALLDAVQRLLDSRA
jgi:DNA-binding response OmpR family regulator